MQQLITAAFAAMMAYFGANDVLAAEEVVSEEYYDVTADYGYYEDYYEEPYYEDTYGVDEDFHFQGVREYDGRTETWYSSNVLYHKDTAEWYVDDEGYYRDEDGYYVVAASDMEEGTTFEGSKGTCIVLDCGCSEGITDYYVNW